MFNSFYFLHSILVAKCCCQRVLLVIYVIPHYFSRDYLPLLHPIFLRIRSCFVYVTFILLWTIHLRYHLYNSNCYLQFPILCLLRSILPYIQFFHYTLIITISSTHFIIEHNSSCWYSNIITPLLPRCFVFVTVSGKDRSQLVCRLGLMLVGPRLIAVWLLGSTDATLIQLTRRSRSYSPGTHMVCRS